MHLTAHYPQHMGPDSHIHTHRYTHSVLSTEITHLYSTETGYIGAQLIKTQKETLVFNLNTRKTNQPITDSYMDLLCKLLKPIAFKIPAHLWCGLLPYKCREKLSADSSFSAVFGSSPQGRERTADC